MTDPWLLIDTLVRGAAIGALVVTGLAIWRSGVARSAQVAGLAMAVSTSAWLITEAHPLWDAFGHSYLLMLPALPVGACYWLFVLTVFEDRRINPLLLLPALILVASGLVTDLVWTQSGSWMWVARNIFSGGLAVHAALIIARGWPGDLIESRRRLRAVLMLMTSLYVVLEVGISLAYRIDPSRSWLTLSVGEPAGGAIIAALILAIAALFLQARAALFGPAPRPEPVVDARNEAADRLLIAQLDEVMAAGAWRREGLTIGDLAADLHVPEHRLRRLINQRLGHRNFADFVNGRRIEAAKARLADPAEARTTVAAIAFDLGYGSLGPFNRAFRAATGVTPTEWRRTALDRASPKLREAV